LVVVHDGDPVRLGFGGSRISAGHGRVLIHHIAAFGIDLDQLKIAEPGG
jgi:hypothetical protein